MPLTVEYGGKKKAIPGTPASVLAEIFMQACDAFVVDPSLHTLRYKKKALDLTLPMRLANLPAGSVVEMCEIDAKEAAARTVQVVLQRMVMCEASGDLVPDGARSQGAFPCTKKLWDVLRALEDISGTRLVSECDQRGEVPCVTCMNSKKEGKDALESTSLLHLGFVSGSALIKHSFSQAAPSAPPVSTPVSAPAPAAPDRDLPQDRATGSGEPTQPAQDAKGAGDDMEVESESEKKAAAGADAFMSKDAQGELSGQSTGESAASEKHTLETKMGEREYIVGRPREDGGAELSTMEVDVDDGFFELTAADFAVLEAAKKAREKQPAFKTRKMRDMEREAKLSAFKDVKIRFIFPNQHFVQGLFSPTETLAHVFDFVRGTLVQQDRPFVLTTTPPPAKLLEDDKTLIKYTHLMPSARVYFTWAVPPLEPPYMAFTYVSKIQQLEEEQKRQEQSKAQEPEEAGAAAASSQRPDKANADGAGAESQGGARQAGPFVAFPDGKGHSLGGQVEEGESLDSEEERRKAAMSAAERRQSASSGKGMGSSSSQRAAEGLRNTDAVMQKAPKWFKMA